MLERRILPSRTPAHRQGGILSVGNRSVLCPSLHSQVFHAINYSVFGIKLPGAGLPLKKGVPIRDRCVMNAWEVKCLGGGRAASQENALSPAVGSDTESFPRAREGFFRLVSSTLRCLGITPPPPSQKVTDSQLSTLFGSHVKLFSCYFIWQKPSQSLNSGRS